jgi:hypothetical protein
MSRQHHYLKTETEYYQAIEEGTKKFELRKNDRDFRRHDMLYLKEVVNGIETRRQIGGFEIQYVLKDCPQWGLKKGFCIINW